jgi:hypothetical protein
MVILNILAYSGIYKCPAQSIGRGLTMCTVVEGLLWRTDVEVLPPQPYTAAPRQLTPEESAAADAAIQMAAEMGG